MIIKKTDIENFGKFSGRAFSFKPGFNLIFGKNEDGKSTLMSFIKLMFYGNSGSKSQDIAKSPRKKYLPWNGMPMSGSVEFDIDNNSFRLHKEFNKSAVTDKTTLYNTSTGEKTELHGTVEAGQHFFNMDIGEFERSVFIDNYGGFTSETSGNSLALRISNLSVSGDENLSYSEIFSRLTDAKEELSSKSGKKGLLVDEKHKLNELISELEELKYQKESQFMLIETISSLQAEIAQLEATLENYALFQKSQTAQKDLNIFTELIAKYDILDNLQVQLKAYDIPKHELRNIISQSTKIQKDLKESYANIHSDTKEYIPDTEYSEILETQKKLDKLNTDIIHLTGSIRNAADTLEKVTVSNRKRYKILSRFGCIISLLSVFTATASFLTNISVSLSISFSALSALFFALTLFTGYKAKKVEKNINVRLAANDYQNALRLLSFYNVETQHKSISQLLEECDVQKTKYTDYINSKLQFYRCSTIAELSLKTVSSHNVQLNSSTERIQYLQKQLVDLISAVSPVDTYEQAEKLILHITSLLNHEDEVLHDIETLSKMVLTGTISPEFVKSQVSVLTKVINDSENLSDLSDINPDEIKSTLLHKRRQLGELQSKVNMPDVDLNQLNVRITESREKINQYTKRFESITVALQALEDAISEMRCGLGSYMSKKTGEYLEMISDGKYADVIVTRELNAEIRAENTTPFHQWKYLSSGAIDKLYLSLRLAATNIIAEKHNPLPLFFDDILAQYDDESCECALKFLKKYLNESDSVSQILFFTCHRHIAETAKKIFSDINEISL